MTGLWGRGSLTVSWKKGRKTKNTVFKKFLRSIPDNLFISLPNPSQVIKEHIKIQLSAYLFGVIRHAELNIPPQLNTIIWKRITNDKSKCHYLCTEINIDEQVNMFMQRTPRKTPHYIRNKYDFEEDKLSGWHD